MRVAIIAESFLPNVNGVTNSILRVLEHLRAKGHEALVIAPGARDGQEEIFHYEGYRIARVPTIEVPGVNSLPVGVPMPSIRRELKTFQPDVVHLASPFVLGGAGALVAKAMGLPCVAVYQTDVAGFANNYRMSLLSKAAWRWIRSLHNMCALTLAPSTPAIEELNDHGVKSVNHWGRGVDTVRFHPSKRSDQLRSRWLLEGERKRRDSNVIDRMGVDRLAVELEDRRAIVGFVGRLAAEKSVEKLAALNGRDDVQLVIVGDGKDRVELEKALPTAVFTGGLYGDDLPQAYASLDVFVHAGQFETFCQAVQEAHASGVPTIAPAAGGPMDLITPGYNGFLLSVAAFEKQLTDAVDALIYGEMDLFRSNALAGVQNKTWSSLCDQLLGYYGQATGAHQRGKRVPAAPVKKVAAAGMEISQVPDPHVLGQQSQPTQFNPVAHASGPKLTPAPRASVTTGGYTEPRV